MSWYLDSPELLIGGLICVVIGGLLGLIGHRAAMILAGVFVMTGLVSALYSFAGPGLRPVQFLVVCGLFVAAGVNIFRSGGKGSKAAGAVIVVIAGLAFINASLQPLDMPLLDRDFSGSVGASFQAFGDVLEAIFDRATENDPHPRRREPIP